MGFNAATSTQKASPWKIHPAASHLSLQSTVYLDGIYHRKYEDLYYHFFDLSLPQLPKCDHLENAAQNVYFTFTKCSFYNYKMFIFRDKGTTKNAHTQVITTNFFKKKKSFFIIRRNMPIMLAWNRRIETGNRCASIEEMSWLQSYNLYFFRREPTL